MTAPTLATPWHRRGRLYGLPTSLVVKLAAGEVSESIPTTLDVRSRAQAPAASVDGGVVDRLIRHHAEGARVARLYSAAASLGHVGQRHTRYDDLEHVLGLSRTLRIEVPLGTPIDHLIDALSQSPTVEAAGANHLCTAPFEMSSPGVEPELAWASRAQIKAPAAMAYEPGDPAMIVAIVDSGIPEQHSEFEDRFRTGYNAVQLHGGDLAPGLRLLNDDAGLRTRPIDHHVGHGTGCAGIIGARGNSLPPGLAGECPMLPIRVLGAANLPGKTGAIGIGALADIDHGVKMAVDLDARVLNMSFGTADSALDATAPKPHRDVIQYALARGCVLVAASGNSGVEEIFWPAAFDGVIAVAAVDASGRPTAFSTRGAHVALAAPGENIITTGLVGLQVATGTSFAAPFVAAAAALLVSRAGRRSFPIDGAQVRQLLIESAAPFPGRSVPGCGAGLLDAQAALVTLDRAIDAASDAKPDDGDER